MGSNAVWPNWTDTTVKVDLVPIRNNSTFMIDVNTILGSWAQFPYLSIFREVNGVNTNLLVSTSADGGSTVPAAALGTYEADYYWGYTAQQTHFKVFDTPNTTSPVRYKLMISGSGGGGYYSYIGGAWYWLAYITTPRADDMVMTPTTMTVFEIQS